MGNKKDTCDVVSRSSINNYLNALDDEYKNDDCISRILKAIRVGFNMLKSEDIDLLYSRVHDIEGYQE